MPSFWKMVFAIFALCVATFAAPVASPSPTNVTVPRFPICDDIPLSTEIMGQLCFEPIISQAPKISNFTEVILPRFQTERTGFTIGPDRSKKWCAKVSRGAPQPTRLDSMTLCHNLPQDMTIEANLGSGTQYKNNALCMIFDQGTARYRVCNLDTCGSQKFEKVNQQCFSLYHKCPAKGHTSGYRVGLNDKGQGFATALTGVRMMGDYPFEHNDDTFLVKQFERTCA